MPGNHTPSSLKWLQATAWTAFISTMLIALAPTASAEQRIDLEGTAIFGNKESPNILYVVPWRKSNQIGPLAPPRMGQLDDILNPLDREVFRRQVNWHQTFGEKP